MLHVSFTIPYMSVTPGKSEAARLPPQGNTRKFISTFKAIKLHTKTNLQKYFLPPRFLKNIEDKSRKLCNVGQSKYLDRNTSRKRIATQLAESDAITQPSGTQTASSIDSKMPTHPRKKKRKNAIHIHMYLCFHPCSPC